MPLEPSFIAGEDTVYVEVSGPAPIDRMYLCTGTAGFSVCGKGNDWHREMVTFFVGPSFKPGQYQRAVVTGSLASVDAATAHEKAVVGWAIDELGVDWDDKTGRARVTARVAVKDAQAQLLRLAFQVVILADMQPSC